MADNRAFFVSGELQDVSGKTLLDGISDVTVSEHSHDYKSETGKCACGKTCDHANVDSKTGICGDCGYQLTAGISGVETPSYYGNIDDAFAAAVSEENNGCALTLYKNCELTDDPIIDKTLTLNVNGKTITASDKEIIVRLGTLTLTGGGKIDGKVTVPSGTLINGVNDTNDSKAVSITNLYANYIGEEPHIELYGGVYDSFAFNTYDPDVTIYGGSFGKIKSESETSLTVNTLLAKNRAFVRTLPAELIDGSAVILYEGLTNVSVVEHTHVYDETNTKCACGAVLYATVTTADGEVTYYDDITKAAAAAAETEGSTLTLVSRDQTGDIVMISGGKFTVDLAGVPALYEFEIIGGDVTFKSSEEFSSDYSDRCNITVNGYSAKVTIDGKIELETDGTLTTNSTEAYINDLSIYGGKADIDGAYIRTIMINGGNTVIKDVIAHLLFMEGSRLGNLSIVSGHFDIVTFSGYALGKAIVSGSRVIGTGMYPVLYEYAGIQNETEISSIAVEKCDHKDENGSFAFNDGGICTYCNSEFVASVSYTADGSEKTEPFSDVCDAFDRANEAGTATVTLYKDNSDGLTRAIHVTGNVTLELNGHDLSITYYTRTITVDDGGTLTVNGGENDELLIVEGLSGSKIIVNGGSLTTLIAEGDAELAGGSFGDIICTEGITVDSLLAPGYAYKNSDGTWVSIADRENTSISNVTVTEAPVLSAELTADKTKVYRNGIGKVTFGITTEMRDGNTVSDDNPLSGQGHTTRTVFGTEQLSSTVSISGEASCSYLGMLVNDGEVVEVYYIVKYDGYELRTNTVAIEVDTCDHLIEDTGYDVTGKLVCYECGNAICAEIINGENTTCYSDFEDAMYDAQLDENKGCTVMVTGDISGINFITLYSGLFTLDLAGHKVEFINDRTMTTTGADVTIKDSFGGGSIRSGEGIARVITVQNDGKVTLEGGTIANNVYISSGKLDMCGAIYVSCAGCGLSSKGTASEAVFSGSALGHSLTAWAVTAAATCTADGSQERHCTRCDYQQTKTIAAKGHKFGAWAITKNVSCLEYGEQSRVCSVCKKKEVKTIAATGVHIFSAWKVTKAATCTTAGAKESTCTGCGAKETVVIQATGHKYVESIVKPTYTEKGYTLHKCSVCGNSYKSAYTDKLVLATVTGATLGGRAADALRINWNKNASADGYIVEIYKDGEWSRAGKITNNSTVTFRAEGLKASTVYKLRVRAYKMSGSTAAYSAYSAVVTAMTNPSVMTGVKIGSTAKDALRVNWNKNTSAQGYIVEMYKDGKWVRAAKITDNSTTTFRKAGLAKNTSYRFRVCAYYMSGSTPLYGTYVSVIGKTAAD